jgi:hypothetical protein
MKDDTTPNQKSSALLTRKDTGANTQRLQIVALINKHRSVNTPELRSYGIMSPATRIFELRQQGYDILKVLETYVDDIGNVHHGVARYYFALTSPANKDNMEQVA